MEPVHESHPDESLRRPDVLEIVDVPTPSPGPGEVLVRVRAAGVNFFETLMRQNRYAVTSELSMIPGVEVAGVVEAVGDGVTSPEVGARIAPPVTPGRASPNPTVKMLGGGFR